jgi:hypothetical protein
VADDAYAARIGVSPERTAIAAGATAHLEVSVRNLGSEHWPAAHQGGPPIRLAYRWFAADGQTVVVAEGLRTDFGETVMPGQTTVAMLAVLAPDQPGSYVLEVDLVHEFVRWFECESRVEMSVEAIENGASGSRLARPHPTVGSQLHPPDAGEPIRQS